MTRGKSKAGGYSTQPYRFLARTFLHPNATATYSPSFISVDAQSPKYSLVYCQSTALKFLWRVAQSSLL